MSFEDQKEAASKAICLYVADLLEKPETRLAVAAEVMNVLVAGMVKAKQEGDFKVLEVDFKNNYPKLPAFSVEL